MSKDDSYLMTSSQRSRLTDSPFMAQKSSKLSWLTDYRQKQPIHTLGKRIDLVISDAIFTKLNMNDADEGLHVEIINPKFRSDQMPNE